MGAEGEIPGDFLVALGTGGGLGIGGGSGVAGNLGFNRRHLGFVMGLLEAADGLADAVPQLRQAPGAKRSRAITRMINRVVKL
jgi:hypothetical protein